MHIIAIDCGASFIKCALFDGEKLVKKQQVHAPKLENDVDIFCTDKIDALIEIVKNCLKTFSQDLQETILCFSNEMHGFILTYDDGRPYTDYISWQCELISVDSVKKYLAEVFGEEKYQRIIRHTRTATISGLVMSSV